MSHTFYCATEFVSTYLHNGRLFVAHRDLKSQNIFITPEGGVKPSHFNFALSVEPIPATELPENAALPGFCRARAQS